MICFRKDQHRFENHMHNQNNSATLYCMWSVFKDLLHTLLIFLAVHSKTWEYKPP